MSALVENLIQMARDTEKEYCFGWSDTCKLAVARIRELERMNATRQDIIEILESRQNLPQEDA
jgi:hypothetical protein